MGTQKYSLFTKPWRELAPGRLGALVQSLGLDGVEFPLREGYQVDLKDMKRGLTELSSALAEYGVKITSVASEATEEVFEACEAAGVPLIRVMKNFDLCNGFWKGFDQAKRQLERAVPLCEKYGVTLGVQQHYGTGIFNTMELYTLLKDFDPHTVGAVWDAAHSALSGEDPVQALDIIWDRLCLINMKTAYYRRSGGPEAEHSEFAPYFTTGRYGNTSWEKIAAYLKQKKYAGILCLPAEYTDEGNTEAYIRRDVEYLKSLMN